MSTTTSNGAKETGRPPAALQPAPQRSRLRHTPGGAALGKDAGPEARRLAAAILEVLAGVRTPSQAAEALGVSQARYFQIETRAMQALVAGCAARPRGPGKSAEKELSALKRQHERLQRELSRQQTLVRLAQRHIGLAPPKASAPPGGKGKKRRRRPVVRALRAAEALHQRREETRSQPATPAPGTPEIHPEGKG